MSLNNTRWKKPLSYLLKAIKILGISVLVLFLAVYIYVSANKKSIIAQVTSAISKKINGNVQIGNVDLSFFENFPRVAVRITNVKITDTMYQQHKHLFFESKEVFFTLSIGRLISKRPAVNGVRVKDASIYMFTDTSGYTNTYLLKPKQSDSPSQTSADSDDELNSIDIRNLHFTLNDLKREKLHDFSVSLLKVAVKAETGKLLLDTHASILVNSLAFNIPRGSFMKGKTFKGSFDMVYDKTANQLKFDDINLRLQDQPFNLSGKFDLKKDGPQFTLVVHTRDASYKLLQSLLPQRIAKSLSIVSLDKPLSADAVISGPLKGGEPLLQVSFLTAGTKLVTPFMDFDDAGFSGSYTNEVIAGLPRTDPNSKILINHFTASWHGLPVASEKLEILDLLHPQLSADLGSEFKLTRLNELLGSSALELQEGTGAIHLKYQGPVELNNNTNSFLDGTIAFKNGVIRYAPRDVTLKNVNGAMVFKNSDLFIQQLKANVLGNDVIMDGFAKNLLTLVNTEPAKVNIDWNISAQTLNLASFIYLLKSPNKTVKKKSSNTSLADVSNKIDNALELSKLNVSLKVNRLLYKKFEASNVNATVKLLSDRYVIDNVSMNFGGGAMNLNGALLNTLSSGHHADLNVMVTNVNVQKLFTAFDNFGQNGITAKSLEGTLTAKVVTGLKLNDDGKVLPNSIRSTVDFSLKNGALINYEPIMNLQSVLFKKRDFENVRFAELKDRLDIANGEVTINRMEIQSSVLSMFVEGLFSSKGNTDISIQVPLNNLKKRGADYVPENIGPAGKAGNSIYLRGQPGSDGNIKFKLDLFKKYKKDKKQTSETR